MFWDFNDIKYVIINLLSDMEFSNTILFELEVWNEENKNVYFIITSNSL